ncbi:protein phosphatase 1 regulatory subunit 3B isoform X2 [Teleopsis dalmanni]|uniref:protein phosphatase 1 regulatory subunit 3B isoform X2 n=1 Tax=Teleopsis dalmanni TaxID=139649 RepID=UPI0018CFB61F|nr:protein phosphatase 1 regulatory subunit 3B isoform X2 [Teleopsis dalmanni]
MISHSPPIFSHSPPVSFLSDYMNNHRQSLNYNDEPNRTSRYCRPQVITLASKAMVNNAANVTAAATRRSAPNRNNFNGNSFLERMLSAPIIPTQPKSCLSRKSCLHKNNTVLNGMATTAHTPATSGDSDNKSAGEQSRSRKKVIFADDEGLSLTEVRVMSEPSNVPPYWSMKFLEQITQGLVSPHPADQWTVDFKQPASDYLTFRQKIDSNFVSLENVIVKDEESIVVGTVKVKNIGFEKEVIVRVTWDDWKSQQDIFCTFARAYGPSTCAHVVFDTFAFKITLPPSSKRLEFCICFRAKDKEYWDNNDGTNYTITKRSPFYYNALSPYDKNPTRNSSQSNIMSTLSEALANSPEKQTTKNEWPQEPSPYW